MSKIYTKTGDKGETGLVSGNRISKSDSRIDLYGDVDELNSFIGVISIDLKKHNLNEDYSLILKIQSALFDLGSNLACEANLRDQYKLPQINIALIELMEKAIDRMDLHLPKLKNFILPGGTSEAAKIHVTRTIARRVERKLISFAEASKEILPINSVVFLNRLSDYLFQLARYTNLKLKTDEISWVPFKI